MTIAADQPCPCGSGRPQGQCCLAAGKGSGAAPTVGQLDWVESVTGQPRRAPKGKPRKRRFRARKKRGALEEAFEALQEPGPEMDELLGRLLQQPPDSVDWADVLRHAGRVKHPDLPAVFRRIAAAVPHTLESGMCSFYWSASKFFQACRMPELLPEVAEGFSRLEEEAQDADGRRHIEQHLLAAHFEDEALLFAERGLPGLRKGVERGIVVWPAIQVTCELIFRLRFGRALRAGAGAHASRERLAQSLRRDIDEEIIDPEAAERAVRVICDEAPHGTWKRDDFALVVPDEEDEGNDPAWEDVLRFYDALMGVAREAWEHERYPPGCGYHAVCEVYRSVCDGPREDEGGFRKNLLDYLDIDGLEQRVVWTCQEILGMNEAQARLMLEGYELLLRFAQRHKLIATRRASTVGAELKRFLAELEFPPP